MDRLDQAAGGDWRMQLKHKRAIAALRADDPSRAAAAPPAGWAPPAAGQSPAFRAARIKAMAA